VTDVIHRALAGFSGSVSNCQGGIQGGAQSSWSFLAVGERRTKRAIRSSVQRQICSRTLQLIDGWMPLYEIVPYLGRYTHLEVRRPRAPVLVRARQPLRPGTQVRSGKVRYVQGGPDILREQLATCTAAACPCMYLYEYVRTYLGMYKRAGAWGAAGPPCATRCRTCQSNRPHPMPYIVFVHARTWHGMAWHGPASHLSQSPYEHSRKGTHSSLHGHRGVSIQVQLFSVLLCVAAP
jgi:hypothetical protein